MAASKVWLCIVCTSNQGLYKIKVVADDEQSAKTTAHNLALDKFKPQRIDNILAKEWSPEAETQLIQTLH